VIWTLAKSGSAALVTAAAELSALALLRALGVPLAVAFAAVQIVGISITFTLNKLWVFDAAHTGCIRAEGARSLPVFAGAFVLNTILPTLAVTLLRLPAFAAYLAGQATVYALWSFPLNRWWVFPVLRAIPCRTAGR
jgi:putative flippase GtrA